MDGTEQAQRQISPPLFSWFPAHEVRESEEMFRAEELLAHIPLFSEVPRHHLQAIARVAQRNTYATGDLVIRMGDMGSELHVIRSGRVNVVRDGDGSEELILASLGAGEFFGELSLFDRRPRSATVIAAEPAETLSLGRSDMLEIMNRYPEVAYVFLRSLCHRLRSANNLLENAGRSGLVDLRRASS